jgi:hypothetical protein
MSRATSTTRSGPSGEISGEPYLLSVDREVVLGVHRLPALQRAPDEPEKRVGLRLVEDVVQRAADDLGRRPVRGRGAGGRDLEVATVGIEHHDHVADRGEHCLEFRVGVAAHGRGRLGGGHAGATILTRRGGACNGGARPRR